MDMGLLSKLLGRDKADDADTAVEIILDLDKRRPQLLRLEQALDALSRKMREDHTTHDPGWRGRVNEYSRLAGEAMMLRQTAPTRDQLLDLVFEIRPVFNGAIPEGMEDLGPLQDEVMAAANQMRELLPGEKR
jgi:hypothetical protein